MKLLKDIERKIEEKKNGKEKVNKTNTLSLKGARCRTPISIYIDSS